MKVSIITACLNNRDTVGAAIESLNIQDYGNIEHIVKDGGSTDGTVDLIRQLRPVSQVFSEKDGGLFDALNQAMSLATGDIIGILHADDFFIHAKVLSNVVDCFKKDDPDAVYGNLLYVDRIRHKKVIRKWISGKYEGNAFLYGWMPPHPAFFVRKSVLDRYGPYKLEFGSAADYEWMLRLIHKEGIRLAYLDDHLVAMRTGGKSNESLRGRIRANRLDRLAWTANGLNPKWYTLFLKPLRKLPQFF